MTETTIHPGDLAPQPAAPERLDPDAIRPGDPRWAREAAELIRLGFPDPEVREAARERLVSRAIGEAWSLRALGRAILTERAEASEALGPIDARHAIDQRAPGAEPDPGEVWQRVARAPRQGEVTNASRLAGGGF